jgi:UDP-N-acetylmuramate--alanine ligase
MYQKKYHIHFVGIGGIGMSGIAELLLNLGYKVSGSDIRESDITRNLERLGGLVYQGHDGANVAGADVVVRSSIIRPDNPEVLAAKKASIPVIPRAEMLAELMRLKYSVAIAGAHGKTTTTSLVAAVLGQGGFDPTVVIGGKLKSINTNAVLGQGEFIVAEADESDGSFLKYSPTIAVVTNIDREHLDFYRDMEDIQTAFLQFLDRVPFYGLSVLCLDNEPIQDILPRLTKRHTTYGLTSQADFMAKKISFAGLKSRFEVYRHSELLGEITLNLPGVHNIYNSLASIAVGCELDIPFEVIKQALENLEGVQRRMEIKGEVNGVVVIDDYGHHPTEIKSTLKALGDCWPEKRKVVVFQPHRFSRTQALFDEFATAFYQSDLLLVLPIYAAGEDKISGVDAEKLCEAIEVHGHKEVLYMRDQASAVAYLKSVLSEKDILLTLGAGDVWKAGEALLEKK